MYTVCGLLCAAVTVSTYVISVFDSSIPEVVGAVISVLVIWVVTGILVYLAVLRIVNQDYTINADIMLITAGASVAVNVL